MRFSRVLLPLLLSCLAGAAGAQEPAPKLDERTATVLRQMSDYLAGQQEFTYAATVTYEVVQESEGGEP